jgi:hypothetical protein
VWKALDPCLRLASLVRSALQIFHWNLNREFCLANMMGLTVFNERRALLMVCLFPKRCHLCRLRYLTWIRWDALFNGDFKEIDPQRIPSEHAGKALWSFHERTDTVRNQDTQIEQLQFRFKEAAKSIKLRFQSGHCNPRTGVVDSKSTFYGQTDTNFPPAAAGLSAVITVAIELVQPLLSADLNYNER